ncbi:MAG: hypothetical protein ACRETL_18165, partial [Gammaproteobacteria bacterium]
MADAGSGVFARPPLPYLQDFVNAGPRPHVYPAGPNKIAGLASEPQLTLPSPALPPELERFEEGSIVTVLGSDGKSRPRAFVPGWLISVVVALAMLIAGIAVVFYILPGAGPNQSQNATAAGRAQNGPAPVSAAAASQQPLAQSLEITGFRIGVDLTNTTVVQYIVVNHSPSEIANSTVNVTVKAARGHFQHAPVVSFSFRLPSIGGL